MVYAVFESLFIQTCFKQTKTGVLASIIHYIFASEVSGNVENTSRKLTILKC